MEAGDVIDEAVERAGIDPSSLGHRHYTSIQRSLTLIYTEIEKAIPGAEFRQVETTLAVGNGAHAVELPYDVINVNDVTLVRADGNETWMTRISRQDYLNYSRQDSAGTPTAWWVSKSLPGEVDRLPAGLDDPTSNMLLVIWPPMGLTGASVRVSYSRQTASPTNLGTAVDARRENLEVLCRGLAAAVAQKYNPPMWKDLLAHYRQGLTDENTDMHPVVIAFRGPGWARGRRH